MKFVRVERSREAGVCESRVGIPAWAEVSASSLEIKWEVLLAFMIEVVEIREIRTVKVVETKSLLDFMTCSFGVVKLSICPRLVPIMHSCRFSMSKAAHVRSRKNIIQDVKVIHESVQVRDMSPQI